MRLIACLVCILLCFSGLHGKEKIDSLLTVLGNHERSDSVRVALLNQIGYEYWIVDPNASELYGLRALALAQRLELQRDEAFARRVIGVAHWARGNYSQALEYLLESLEIYRSLSDTLGEANILMNVGLVYSDQKIEDLALEYFKRAVNLFEHIDAKSRIATTYTKIGTIYANKHRFDEADNYFRKALKMHESDGFIYGIAEVSNRLGIVAFEQERYREATVYFTKSLQAGSTIEDRHGMASNYLFLGKINLLEGKFVTAEEYLHRAKQLAEKIELKQTLKDCFWALKELAMARGNTSLALYYFERYDGLRDTLFNEELTLRIAEMESKLRMSEKESELALKVQKIELLEKQNRLSSALQWAFLAALLATLVAAFFVYKSQSLKIRNTELRQKELEQHLEYKNKELANYAIQFVRKGELLREVKAGINQLRDQLNPENAVKLKDMEKQLDQSFQLDKDWENFKQHFESLHSNFFSSLKAHFPALSPNDLRLCALLRLNLSIKEMASILNLSPDSVKTARYRLRKKLELDHEDSLLAFLLGFEQEMTKS